MCSISYVSQTAPVNRTFWLDIVAALLCRPRWQRRRCKIHGYKVTKPGDRPCQCNKHYRHLPGDDCPEPGQAIGAWRRTERWAEPPASRFQTFSRTCPAAIAITSGSLPIPAVVMILYFLGQNCCFFCWVKIGASQWSKVDFDWMNAPVFRQCQHTSAPSSSFPTRYVSTTQQRVITASTSRSRSA